VSEAHHLVAHQFEQPEQQAEAVSLGMWAFLITEVLFFGALFAIYGLYRYLFPDAWVAGSKHLDRPLGMLNTGILLVSSLTMALAVHAAQESKRRATMVFLALTILLAFGFLAVKTVEYSHKWHDHLVPGRANFGTPAGHAPDHAPNQAPDHASKGDEQLRSDVSARPQGGGNTGRGRPLLSREGVGPQMDDGTRKLQLFFALYFCMTGLHAIHVIIGIGMLGVLMFLTSRNWFSADYYSPVEMTGLYWHFVDIVWVFLFPLLYLIS
jgi:cytochrome c oxidase subunit 3